MPQEPENWTDIHRDFHSWRQKEWEKPGFNKEQAKEVININVQGDHVLMGSTVGNQANLTHNTNDWQAHTLQLPKPN